ncbi:hypothetical protein B0T14DRAFT_554729 [Immersiella caudata]|uniref:Uncharacterized protein n=1 Tax=Immersiella caudata TaxID=314043 RepID=A0AA40BZG1_9PEZI|nr:hypothetical protein B0T14DRAFT_554729 [Immersiella caudata]
MHISSVFALALGLAPAWAVPVLELPALDISPGAIPLDKFRLGGDIKLLKPKLPALTGRLDFNLKKRIALNWNDDGDDITKAELTANWDEQEDVKVIDMSDFGSALEKVDCTAPTMSLDFKQSGPYNQAKASWSWVNGASKNNIIMFVNHPSCGDDKAEAPFRVTAIRYDDVKFVAYMTVQEITDLESIIPDGDLVVETLADVDEPIVNTRDLESADLDKRIVAKKTTTISLNRNFDNKNIFSLGSGANYLKLDCTDCGTRGKIKVKLYAKIRWFRVKQSYVEFRAEDVSAFLNLKLHGKGSKTGKGHKVVVPITAYGFEIKRVATLRIAADIGVGYDASIDGEGNVTWGATAKLTSPSVWRECFKGCDDEKTGWVVSTTTVEPKGAGSLKAKLGVHAFITPKAEARIFKSGYEVGVAILAPKFEGTAKVSGNSNGGICANTKAILGVDVDLKVGLQCYVYAGDNYQTPDWRKTLFEKMWTVYDKCFVLAKKP